VADDSKIQVVIELDDGSVKQGFLRVEKSAQETTGKIAQFFERAGAVAAGIFAEKVVTAGLNAIKNALKDSLGEAIRADEAVNKLNTSLRLAGTFSAEASNAFQSLASELQRSTAFSDEQALSAAALARNFAKTNEQAIALTKAAADLAVATGTDLDTAVTKLGGTLSGSIGLLGKQVPALKNLSAASLEAGGAITVIADRFSGAAALGANTFSGALTKLGNSFSDVLEEIGRFATRSPALLAVFNVITDRLGKFASAIAGVRENGGDIFKPIILSLADFGQAVIKFGIAPLELLFNTTETVINGIRTILQGFIFGSAEILSTLVGFFAPDSAIAKGLATFADSSFETLDQFAEKTRASFNKNLDFNVSAGLSNFVNEISGAAAASTEAATVINNNLNSVKDTGITLSQSFASVGQGMADQMRDLNANASKNFQQIGRTITNTIGTGVGNAFAAFGRAIAKGKDGLKSFTNSLLATMGQMAVQLGTMFIAQGVASTFAGLPNGPALIAAGAALAAYGGLLSALAPSDGGGTVGAASATGGFAPSTPSIDETGSVDLKSQQRVIVNIQGDVLDSRETSLRIVELINEGIAEQGAQITARAN
jgi:hypothetical protein